MSANTAMQIQIEAAQLFYANVAPEHSPSGRGGFQTLAHDPSLTARDVEEIEARLLYLPGPDTPPKGVFFALGDGRLVAARIMPLAGSDDFGRGGRYLAHALVINGDAWERAGLDPCAVLAHAPFVSDLDRDLALVTEGAGLSPLALDAATVTAPSLPCPAWSPALLGHLMRCALRAEERVTQREVLALIGPAPAVEQALAAVLAGVPMALRPACTFDSNFAGGNLVWTPWWAVGLPAAPAPGRYFRVDLASGAALDALAPLGPRTPYETWLLGRIGALAPASAHGIKAADWQALSPERETAYTLCRWLDGVLPPTALPEPEQMPPDVLAACFAAAPSLVQQRVRARLEEVLPAPLTDLIWPLVEPGRADLPRYRELRSGFAPTRLADWLWTALVRNSPPAPPKPRQRALARWLETHPEPRLALLLHCWAADWPALSQALAALDADAYRRLLPILLRSGQAPPPRLLIPGRGADLVAAWLPLRAQVPLALPSLVEALLRQRDLDALAPLTPLLAALRPRERKALLRLVEPDAARLPAGLIEALTDTAAEPDLLGRIKGWWQR